MSVTNLQLRKSRERVSSDDIQLRPDEIAIAGMNSVAARRAGRAVDHVERIMCICEPEAMSFDGQAQPGMRFDLKDGAHVMDVLEREEIHVAVELVVGREQVVESLMPAVAGVAITSGEIVFQSQARFAPEIRKRVTTLSDNSKRVLGESL